MEIENARIRSTHIGFEDHGIFSFNIDFEGGSWGQGTGHLFADKELSRLVRGTLKALGANKWEDLPRMLVRIQRDEPFGKIVAVGDALKENWFTFCPDEAATNTGQPAARGRG